MFYNIGPGETGAEIKSPTHNTSVECDVYI